jgi:DNA repair exonuclease SbcCD ATPase subunit
MSLEDTTLTIGDTSFKGVWIAIVLGIGSTIGGGVWTASSLYSRLEAVEAISVPNIAPLEESIVLIQQELKDNNVSQLQGKLAELGVNLKTIAEQQDKLLLIRNDVNDMKQEIEAMKATVKQAELVANNLGDVKSKLDTIDREVEDLWQGMDYLSNPLR